jgi:hypothetical protein
MQQKMVARLPGGAPNEWRRKVKRIKLIYIL